MIDFARPDLQVRYVAVHRELKVLLRRLASFCRKNGYPPPCVVGLDRDEEWYERNNVPKPKSGFSWHYPLPTEMGDYCTWTICAVDLRKRHYSAAQQAAIIDWLKENCPVGQWEFIHVAHGTGPHFHVAYRDFLLRRAWEQYQRKVQKNGTSEVGS